MSNNDSDSDHSCLIPDFNWSDFSGLLPGNICLLILVNLYSSFFPSIPILLLEFLLRMSAEFLAMTLWYMPIPGSSLIWWCNNYIEMHHHCIPKLSSYYSYATLPTYLFKTWLMPQSPPFYYMYQCKKCMEIIHTIRFTMVSSDGKGKMREAGSDYYIFPYTTSHWLTYKEFYFYN